MAILIPAWPHPARRRRPVVGGSRFRLLAANPTVWLERLQTPALTEFLQVIYTLFLPVVFLIHLLLWRQQRYTDIYY